MTEESKPVYRNGDSLGNIFKENEAAQNAPQAVTPVVSPIVDTNTQSVPDSTPDNIPVQTDSNAAPEASTPDATVEENSATMVLPDFDAPNSGNDVNTEKPVVTQNHTFDWKEEVKKLDKQDILKELGFSDFAIELNEHISRGGKAEDYIAAKAINYDLVSDEDLIKEEYKKQYPNLTKEEINRFYNRKYGIHDDLTDDEKMDRSIELKADAHVRREARKAEQSKFKIPEQVTPVASQNTQQQEQDRQLQLQEQMRWFNEHEATKTLMNSKRVALDLGEFGVFNVNVDKPETLMRVVTDNEVWQKLTSTPQGEPDVAALQEIALFALNRTQFKRDIFNYGKSVGIKELVKDGQNIRIPAKPMPQQPVTNEKDAWKNAKTGTVGGRQ